MKKRSLFFASMAMLFALVGNCIFLTGSPRVAHAEENVPPAEESIIESESTGEPESIAESESEVVELPCKVVVSATQYGDVIVDKESGNVGDIVTVYAKPYSLFKLKSITVNGTVLVANADGIYTFAMIEGENKVSAEFEISQSEVSYILGLIEDAKNGNFEDIFSLKNLLTLISWAISLFMGSGFCITLLKSKKIKAQTAQEISEAVDAATKSEVAKGISAFLSEQFGPSFDALSTSINDISETCQSMARCMVLGQENTPEARLAIIQELSSKSKKAESLADEVKKIVHAEMADAEKAKQDKLDLIEELEAKNQAIGTDTSAEEKPDDKHDLEGRY